uniref:AAA domain-containing protein n=1 Tax=Globodera pallida TaxID=36090 RepID=A0A183BKW8_GLOPA
MARGNRGGNSNSPRRTEGRDQRGRAARTPSVRAAVPRRQQQEAPAVAARQQQQHDVEADAARNEDAPDRSDQAAQQLPEELRQFARGLKSAVVQENGRVPWSNIQGLEGAKNALIYAALLPIVRPAFFFGARRRTKGILLFGPPGTGKTLLARALANGRPETTFLNVTSATLTAPLLGESEKIVQTLFTLVGQNTFPFNCVFDEIDAICSQRGGHTEHEASRRIKSEILMNMDGRGWHCSIMRAAATAQFWEAVTAGTNLTNPHVLAAVADSVIGRPITMAHFERAILRLHSSVAVDLNRYEAWMEQHGSSD